MALDSHKRGSLYNIVATTSVFVIVFGLTKYFTDATTSVSVMFGLTASMFIYVDSLATTTRDETNERLKLTRDALIMSIVNAESKIAELESKIADAEFRLMDLESRKSD
jgi:hypothetical protein